MVSDQIRAGRWAICVLLCLLAAWGVFETTFRSAMLLAIGPIAAERFWPGSAEALAESAELRLAGNDVAGAAADSRRALERVPVKIAALRTLGLAEQARGDLAQALRWIILSGKWGWRDTPTQIWLMNWTLAQRDYRSAMQYADALLRRDVGNHDFYLALLPVLQDRDARSAFIARLQDQPPWRADFFAAMTEIDPAKAGAMTGVLTDLATTATPPTRLEAAPYLRLMVGQSDYDAAYALWGRLFAGPRDAGRAPPNGDFARADARMLKPEEMSPFDWQLGMPGSAVASVEQTGEPARGLALYAQYDGAAGVDLTRVLLVLRPGAYRLSALMRSDAADAPDSLVWSISCHGDKDDLGVTPGANIAAGRWTPVTAEFVVPASGCAAQDLRLRGLPGARTRDVSAWFDDVTVARAEFSSVRVSSYHILSTGAPLALPVRHASVK